MPNAWMTRQSSSSQCQGPGQCVVSESWIMCTMRRRSRIDGCTFHCPAEARSRKAWAAVLVLDLFLKYAPQRRNQAVTFVYHFARPYTNTPTKHQENIAAVGLDGYRVLVEGEGVRPLVFVFAHCLLRLEEENGAVAEVEVDEVLRLCCVAGRQSLSVSEENPIRRTGETGSAYRASRSCQSCDRQCSATLGPCGRRTIMRHVSFPAIWRCCFSMNRVRSS